MTRTVDYIMRDILKVRRDVHQAYRDLFDSREQNDLRNERIRRFGESMAEISSRLVLLRRELEEVLSREERVRELKVRPALLARRILSEVTRPRITYIDEELRKLGNMKTALILKILRDFPISLYFAKNFAEMLIQADESDAKP